MSGILWLLSIPFSSAVAYTGWANTLFSWHPVTMSIAAFSLFPLGTLIISKDNVLMAGTNRNKKGLLHGIIVDTAFVFMLIGFITIYLNKNNNHKDHFTSYHSYFGVITMILMIINILLAFKNSIKFKLNFKIYFSWMCKTHRLVGKLTSIFIILTASSGLLSNWGQKNLKNGILIPLLVINGLHIIQYTIDTFSSLLPKKKSRDD